MALILHGFRYNVYVRIARIALAEKGLDYAHVEVDPFATDVPIEYLTCIRSGVFRCSQTATSCSTRPRPLRDI